jgi:hypothetical protein
MAGKEGKNGGREEMRHGFEVMHVSPYLFPLSSETSAPTG